MSIDPHKAPHTPVGLEFKSSHFSVPVLVLLTDDLRLIEERLQEKVGLAPEFFRNSPLVLDLQELNKQGSEIDIAVLVGLVRGVGLLPIGLRAGTEQQNKQAFELMLPVYSIHSLGVAAEAQKPKTPPAVTEPQPQPDSEFAATTLVTQPIRSGQRIYAAGDLVIMSQVSAGAEIMAEGNIHVYNTLRGRASAGVRGNPDARIFCFDLQAEIISIAGIYKISEDLDASVRGKPIQVYLQDETLVIKDIVQHH